MRSVREMSERELLDALVDLDLEEEAEARRYPLVGAMLWRPRCEQWLGLPEGQDERPKGCGEEMTPHAPGRFVCETPGCAMEGVVEQRTSQRDAYIDIALLWGVLIAALIGGANRAGKTESAMQLAVAMAAGGDEPWVQQWLKNNGLPLDLIPPGPGKVWVSSLSFNDSLEYHRPKLDKYLPEGTTRRNWNAEHQAKATLPNGGEVICKADAQGRDKFQGDSVRLVVLDEEHSREVYDECLRATAETPPGEPAGLILLSMTPLKGVTWPHAEFVAEPDEEHYSTTITGLDNPHVDSTELRRRFKKLSPEKRDARLLGKWATAKGIIYPQFSRAVHVIPDRVLPPHWRRFRAIDFGINFACLWGALDPDKDQLHFYRALKTYDVPLSENGRLINALSANEVYAWTIADPADRDARMTLARDHGIATAPARKAIDAGLDAVHERLALYDQGHPGAVYHETAAKELIDEKVLYKRDEKGVIVKSNDHLSDCERYLTYYLSLVGSMGCS